MTASRAAPSFDREEETASAIVLPVSTSRDAVRRTIERLKKRRGG
jgi:hypothetical protein